MRIKEAHRSLPDEEARLPLASTLPPAQAKLALGTGDCHHTHNVRCDAYLTVKTSKPLETYSAGGCRLGGNSFFLNRFPFSLRVL